MQKYDSYKDSGVQWLGEIPSHWEVKPGRVIYSENKEKNDGTDRDILSLSYGSIIKKKDINEGLVPAEYSNYQIIRPGYLVVRCTDLQNDKVSLRTAVSEYEGLITGAYLALIPNKAKYNAKFLHYYMRAWDNCKELYRHGSGLRQSLSWQDFKYVKTVVPPLCEQITMASYLDAATAKIDEAIAQQQKMIELLNERKQIIINNAVTKGLDPNAKMKDSGVEWIGMVPEKWEVKRLKQIAKLQSGDTINSDSFTENGYPVYGGNGFRGYTDKYTNDGNYVLIGRQGALCGNVNYAFGKFFASEHAVVVYPYHKENIYWLGEVIRSSNLNQYSQSAAQPGLAVSLIQNISYPYPPSIEREEIACYIKKQIEIIDNYATQCHKQISLLQERKQITINEVVTGKVKVS